MDFGLRAAAIPGAPDASIASSTTSRFGEISRRFSASFSTRFHCSDVKRMFFCAVCAIRFVRSYREGLQRFRSQNDRKIPVSFKANTLVANREGPRIDAGIRQYQVGIHHSAAQCLSTTNLVSCRKSPVITQTYYKRACAVF